MTNLRPTGRAPTDSRPARQPRSSHSSNAASVIRPLAQIRTTQNDGSGVAQARDQGRVARGASDQRRRAREPGQTVYLHVVLDQNGDTVQRAERASALALVVAQVGLRARVIAHRGDGVEGHVTVARIHLLDSLDEGVNEVE